MVLYVHAHAHVQPNSEKKMVDVPSSSRGERKVVCFSATDHVYEEQDYEVMTSDGDYVESSSEGDSSSSSDDDNDAEMLQTILKECSRRRL